MKKPPTDPKTCASCESYQPVKPGDGGYCYLMPPIWIEVDGIGRWARPGVLHSDYCRFHIRKLNS